MGNHCMCCCQRVLALPVAPMRIVYLIFCQCHGLMFLDSVTATGLRSVVLSCFPLLVQSFAFTYLYLGFRKCVFWSFIFTWIFPCVLLFLFLSLLVRLFLFLSFFCSILICSARKKKCLFFYTHIQELKTYYCSPAFHLLHLCILTLLSIVIDLYEQEEWLQHEWKKALKCTMNGKAKRTLMQIITE